MKHFLNITAILLLVLAIVTAVAGIIQFRLIFIFMGIVEAMIANSIHKTAKKWNRYF